MNDIQALQREWAAIETAKTLTRQHIVESKRTEMKRLTIELGRLAPSIEKYGHYLGDDVLHGLLSRLNQLRESLQLARHRIPQKEA